MDRKPKLQHKHGEKVIVQREQKAKIRESVDLMAIIKSKASNKLYQHHRLQDSF